MEQVWSLAVLILLAAISVCWLYSVLRSQHNRSIPGPKGWPYIGVLPILLKNRDTFHLKLEEWEKHYGKLFTFVLMGQRWYVTSELSLITKMGLARPASYMRWSKIAELGNEIGFLGVFSAEGDSWTRQRRITAPAFSSVKMGDMEASIALVVDRLMRKWDEASREGQAVDAMSDLLKLSLNVVALISLGMDLNALDGSSQVQEDILFMFHQAGVRLYSPFPWWRYKYLASKEDREVEECRKRLEALILDVKERASHCHNGQGEADNLLTRLLRSMEEKTGEKMKLTDDEFVGNILTFFLAGTDTTACTMAWAIFLLATNSNVQAQAYAEVERIFGGEKDVTLKDLVGVNTKELKYLTMVIKETLRLKPPSSYTVYQPTKRINIREGLELKPNEMIILLTSAPAKSEEHFERPLDFEPRRWEGDTRGLGMSPGAESFGLGQRICPGRFLALSEMQLCLAAICHRFVVRLAPDCTAESVQAVETGIVVRPKPLRLQLSRRRE